MAPPKTTLKMQAVIERQLDGTHQFAVMTTVNFLAEGDLPGSDVFVNQVVSLVDPKVDKFLRVANLDDLSRLPRGRDRALDRGVSTYLSATNVLRLPTVHAGVEAKSVMQARIDDLISQWRAFKGRFENPTEFELPLGSSSIITAAKEAYAASVATAQAKDAALAVAQADKTAKTTLAARSATDLTNAQARQAGCSQVQALMSSALAGEAAFRAAAGTFSSASATFSSQSTTFKSSVGGGSHPTYEAQIAVFDSGRGTFNSAISTEVVQGSAVLNALSSAINANCALETAAVYAAAAAKAAADASAASAQTTYTVAQAEAAKAATDKADALAALLEVCPDFEP